MIASTSTLFLATLVFGAASVVGAPVRISDTLSESVARAVVPPTVEPVARAIVDVQDYRRRSNLGAVSRRAARVVYERDEPFAEIVTAREPVSVVTEPTDFAQRETIQRRYPRRHLREFYEKREPASTVKETTMVVSKTTVHDTPADAAAFNAGAAVGSAIQPAVSGFTVKIPLPVVGDGSVQASTSTLLSVSTATTITASSGTATSTATSSSVASDASATASSTASSTDSAAATATASVSASSTDSASATSTATSTDTASAATATTTGTADSTGADQTTTTTTTSVVSADQPAASGAATDGTTSTTTTPATGDGQTADNKDAVVAAVVNGGSGGANADNNKPAITVNGLAPAGAVATTDQSSRRSVKVSTSPIARRTVARSGASWASWARRQMSSVH